MEQGVGGNSLASRTAGARHHVGRAPQEPCCHSGLRCPAIFFRQPMETHLTGAVRVCAHQGRPQ
eukprot:2756426-Amphidinium_carterae.1